MILKINRCSLHIQFQRWNMNISDAKQPLIVSMPKVSTINSKMPIVWINFGGCGHQRESKMCSVHQLTPQASIESDSCKNRIKLWKLFWWLAPGKPVIYFALCIIRTETRAAWRCQPCSWCPSCATWPASRRSRGPISGSCRTWPSTPGERSHVMC